MNENQREIISPQKTYFLSHNWLKVISQSLIAVIISMPVTLKANGNDGYKIERNDSLCQYINNQTPSPALPDYGAFSLQLTGYVTNKKRSSVQPGNRQKEFLSVSGSLLQNEKYKALQKVSVDLLSENSSVDNSSIQPADLNIVTTYPKTQLADWQKWHIIYKSSTGGQRFYQIRNAFSGQMLGISKAYSSGSGNNSSNNGQELQLVQTRVTAQTADSSLWQILPYPAAKSQDNPDGYILINKATGLAIGTDHKIIHSEQNKTAPLAFSFVNPGDATSQIAIWKLSPLGATAYRDDAVVGFFERNEKSLGSVAFDQGNTIQLNWGPNKGKVLWITEDAWDGEQLQDNHQFSCKDFFRYRNSVLIQPSASDWNPNHTLNITRNDSRQHMPRQICDLIEGSEFAWPSVGIELGSKVYLQCAEGDGLGPLKSQSLYELSETGGLEWPVKRLMPGQMTIETRINYSAGMIDGGDGFVYVFGFQGKGYGYSLNLHVARFLKTDPMQWRFWNGRAWAQKPAVGSDASIATGKATVSVAKVNGKYVMMTMDQGFVCDSIRNIYLATADSPTGPFTPLKKVYTIREFLYGKFARYYTPVIHPEFDNGRKELLLTYCLNFSGCGVPDCKDGYLDPYFYRIKGIRIPYSIFGLP